MNLNNWQIHENKTLEDGLKLLEKNHHGIIFIKDSVGKFLGVATDGDIRRSLLNKYSLDTKLKEIANRKYVYVEDNFSHEDLIKKFDEGLKAIPVLSTQKILTNVITKFNFPEYNSQETYARAKAPVRVTFGGGGSDLTHYFKDQNGAVLNATISIYSHALLRKRSDLKIKIFSSDLSEKLEAKDLKSLLNKDKSGKFKLIQSILQVLNPDFGFELHINSDFPIGSGLGGSSTVMSAIIGCFNEFRDDKYNLYEIAELAYQAERILMGVSGGWQDQYASVFGGFNLMEFGLHDNKITPLRLSKDTILELEENLVLCDFNLPHDSGLIHKDQKNHMKQPDVKKLVSLNVDLTYKIKEDLLRGNLNKFGIALDQVWNLKKQFSNKITSQDIDSFYNDAIRNGALGGKLLGAGGGGFFIFYVPYHSKNNFLRFLTDSGKIVRHFNFEGKGLQSWRTRINYS